MKLQLGVGETQDVPDIGEGRDRETDESRAGTESDILGAERRSGHSVTSAPLQIYTGGTGQDTAAICRVPTDIRPIQPNVTRKRRTRRQAGRDERNGHTSLAAGTQQLRSLLTQNGAATAN
jgi:hypothetical protein